MTRLSILLFYFRELIDLIVAKYNMPPINATTWCWEQRTDVPQQSNCIDCGVFSLLFALFSAIKRDFDFTQSDIPYFRRKIVQDLLSGLDLFLLNSNIIFRCYHRS